MPTDRPVPPHPDCPYCAGRVILFDHEHVRAFANKTGISKPHLLDDDGINLAGPRSKGWKLEIVLHPSFAASTTQRLSVLLAGYAGPSDLPTRVLPGSDWKGATHLVGSTPQRDTSPTPVLIVGYHLVWQLGAFRGISFAPIAHLIASFRS